MSGLEIAGVAASILQIAEIGTQLAVKLCGFYHKLKTADQHLQNLSNNVALTSTVLRLLGDNLRKDDQGKLYSTEAFNTTQRALNECKNVFTQIGDSIDQNQNQNSGGGGKTRMRMQRAAKRVSFVVTREQELELLATNLERLKSTLHLMLNVIMYAGQLRSRDEPAVLKSQRDLLQTLLEHKNHTEKRFDDLNARLLAPAPSEACSPEAGSSEAGSQQLLPKVDPKEMDWYYLLVSELLDCIETYSSTLELSRIHRVRDGVMRFHIEEIGLIKDSYGDQLPGFIQMKLGTLSGLMPSASRPGPKPDTVRLPGTNLRLRGLGFGTKRNPTRSRDNAIPESRKNPETNDKPEDSTRPNSSSRSSRFESQESEDRISNTSAMFAPAKEASFESSRVAQEVKRNHDEQTPSQTEEARPAKQKADTRTAESDEKGHEVVSHSVDALVLSWTTVGGDEMLSAYG